MSRRLDVLHYQRLIGRLSELPGGSVEFRFHESYRELVPRPILGQKFEDDLEKGYRSRKGQGLPDFFANLIPEGRLREVIEEAAELESGDDLGLLAFVGRDLPGAVAVLPATEGSEEPPEPIETVPTESDEAGDGTLRFSLAGVQLKFSMLLKESTLTLPAKGESGEWIVKLHSPSFAHLPENEYSMLTWAKAIGLEVPEFQLRGVDDLSGLPRRYAPSDTKVLAIRRYDRDPEGRIHQEDFAQAVGLPPSKKYEQITYEVMARLAGRFLDDDDALDEFVRRLAFVIASGNGDAHLKNWSLFYPDAIRAHWSPVYDQVATVAWEGPYRRELALKLAGVKEFARIDRATFDRFAAKAGIAGDRVREHVDQTLDKMREEWRSLVAELPLPPGHREALREHWRTVPLLRSSGPLD